MSGCGPAGQDLSAEASPGTLSRPVENSVPPEETPHEEALNYCRQLARDTVEARRLEGPDDVQTAKNIYDYLIEEVAFARPVGFDLWFYRGGEPTPPSYVETRSISPLLFGAGSCEDFAAAMVLLLEECGISARYVAGYTLSFQGQYTDHAWVAAELEGSWYHLDPQLEQNITGGLLTYRFFMKTDEEMWGDHLWGEWLLDYVGSRATAEEVERIRSLYTPPLCETPAPPQPSRYIQLPAAPDMEALERELERERAAHGGHPGQEPLSPPPVLVAAQPLVEVTLW